MASVPENSRYEKLCFVGKAYESCIDLEEVSTPPPATSVRVSVAAEANDGFRVVACNRLKDDCRLFQAKIDQQKLNQLSIAGQDRALPLNQWNNYYANVWTSFDYAYLYLITPDDRLITYVPPSQKGQNGKIQYLGNKSFTLYKRESALRDTAEKMTFETSLQLKAEEWRHRGLIMALETGLGCVSLPEEGYEGIALNGTDLEALKDYSEYDVNCYVSGEMITFSLKGRPLGDSGAGFSCDINQPITEETVEKAWREFGDEECHELIPSLDQYCDFLSVWWHANRTPFLEMCLPKTQLEFIDDDSNQSAEKGNINYFRSALADFKDGKVRMGHKMQKMLAEKQSGFTSIVYHECAHNDWANFIVHEESLELFGEAFTISYYELVRRGHSESAVNESLNGYFEGMLRGSYCNELRAYSYNFQPSSDDEEQEMHSEGLKAQFRDLYWTFPESAAQYLLDYTWDVMSRDDYLPDEGRKKFLESRRLVEAYYNAEPFLQILDKTFVKLNDLLDLLDVDYFLVKPSIMLYP